MKPQKELYKGKWTSWRKKRYRTKLSANEEELLWKIIDDFIDNAVLKPRAQLRFFKAVEQLVFDAHVARIRFKKMKMAAVEPMVEEVFRYIYNRWDLIPHELTKHLFHANKNKTNIFKARKYLITTLLKQGLTRYRISKIIGVGVDTPGRWAKYDVDIDE